MVTGRGCIPVPLVRFQAPHPNFFGGGFTIPGQITIEEVITTGSTVTDAAGLLTTATTVITTAMGSVWDLIVGNPLLVVYAGAGLLALGFRFFRRAKRVAR